MSESNIKILLQDLSYVASIPCNKAITTYSYYNNLSKELEKYKSLNLSLKIELEQKEDIISSLLFTKDKIIDDLKIQLEAKNKNDEINKCSICLTNTISHCCVPCGHTYCSDCINETNNCYICRGFYF